MPWTDPVTWVTNEETTAARLNAHLRDNIMMYGPSRPSVYVFQNAVTSVANGIFSGSNILFGSEQWDTDGFHSTTANTDRLTVPSGMNGYYHISGAIRFANNATGKRLALLFLNGSATGLFSASVSDASNAGGESGTGVSIVQWLNAGDYAYLVGTQDSGAALNTSGNSRTWFQMTWLGRDPF